MKKLLLFFCCFFILFASAQEFSKEAFSGQKDDKLIFMENRGQVADAKGNARADVLFSSRSGSTRLWLAKDAIYYQFSYSAGDKAGKQPQPGGVITTPEKKSKLETHRFSVHLEGANPNAQVITEKQSVYTENYYLAHCPNGITGVRGYEKITYKNIYPNIDWVVYSKAGFMEYDFVVNPGGNPADIKLKVKDADAVNIENGELVLKTKLGEVREKQPVTFDSNGNEIATNFVKVKKNTLGFAGNFPTNTTYRIDPQVIWATYYGGISYENNDRVCVDSQNNVYLGGDTSSSSGIASAGYDTSLEGTNDMFIAKFDSSGNRIWATYYGGSDTEILFNIKTDSSGNLYAVGDTMSTSGVAVGGFDTTYGGVWDALIVKFNSNGIRQWSTYYGGEFGDAAYDCAIDSQGNVYVAGYTASTTGVASGGFQNTYSNNTDGFIVKFNSSGSRLWGTYYGNINNDVINSVGVDSNNNVFVAGTTKSTTGIATSGSFLSTFPGTTDQYNAFLAKFTSSGSRMWGTYFGGTATEESGMLAVAADGSVYISGHTASTTGIASGGFQNTFGGSQSVNSPADAYLAKFSNDGALNWSTYYGGSGDDYSSESSLALDSAGNIYLSGYTTSSSNIASGGFLNTYQGQTDGFIAKFSSSGARLWSSYFGGTAYDIMLGCAVDSSNALYLSGLTMSNSGIAQGGFQNTYSGQYDGYLAKISQVNCAAPVNVSGTFTSASAASLSWAPGTTGTPSGYQYAVTTSAMPPPSGTDTTATIINSYPVSAGITQYLHVRANCSGEFSAWTTSAPFSQLVQGDICTSAINLATLTSPYTGTTTGASANYVGTVCLTEPTIPSPDLYYYLSVPNGATLTITQVSNSYDSVVSLAYGNCASLTPISCYDDPDEQTVAWTNTTGNAVNVYLIQDGFNGSSGTFTISWSLFTGAATCGAPTNIRVGNIASNNAALYWVNPPSAIPSGYEVSIRQSSAGPVRTNNGTIDIFSPTTGSPFLATGLAPGTTYYYWIRSACGTNYGAWIYGGSFTTLSTAGCTTATYGQYPSTTYTPSCTGTAETISPNCFASEYTFVRLSAATEYTFSSSVATDYITITDEAGTVTLANGSTPLIWNTGNNTGLFRYYFHADASCAAQNTSRTKFIKCNAVSCPAPTALSTTGTTTSGVAILWNAPTVNPPAGYEVYFSTNNTTPPAVTTGVPNTTTGTTFITTSLSPFTTYYYWVRSLCTNSTGSWVAGGSFTTLACTNATYNQYPSTTYTPLCTGSNETITPSAYAGEYSMVNLTANTQYTFSSSIATDYVTITNQTGSTVFASGITPLVWNSANNSGSFRYYFHTNNTCGEQAASRVRYIRCGSAPCNPPSSLTASNITYSFATISWAVAAGSNVSGYQVEVSTSPTTPSNTLSIVTSSTGTSYIASGLAGNTQYYYWVRTICNGVPGVWVAGQPFSTLPCTNASYGQYPNTVYTPVCTGTNVTITAASYAGEYTKINLNANTEYTFSSSVPTDYITITNEAGTTVLASGVTPLIWNTGSNSGVLRYYFHTNSSCGESNTNRSKFIKCSACATPAPAVLAQTLCGGSDVSDIVASGSNIKWYISATSTTPLANSTLLSTNTYYVTQTINGCESPRAAVQITVNTTPPPTAPDFTLCDGSTVASLTATGTNIKWYDIDFGGAPLASNTPLVSGLYFVTQTVNGCESARNVVTVTIATPPAPNVEFTTPSCTANTGSLTVVFPQGADYTYSINGGNSYQSSPEFLNLAAGTYYVYYKDATGCRSELLQVTIEGGSTPPATPIVNVVQPTCAVGTATITVTSPLTQGLTYSINGNDYQTSNVFNNVASGVYVVSVKNPAGCVSNGFPVSITAAPSGPSAPTVNTTQPTCSVATGSIVITAPTGTGMTYSINGTTYQASATFTGVAAGTYSVTAKNAAGCISTATSVTINAAPTAPAAPTATTVQPTCSVATGSITITAPTGTGMTYSINGTTYQASATFTGVAAGTYSVTAKNAAGCISTATSVTINAAPATPTAPVATLVQPTCSVATGSITITAPTGTGVTYSIDGTTYQSSATFTGVAAGTYSVTAKNAAGCISTATSVTINAAPATPSAPTVTSVQPTCSLATGSVTVTAPTGTGVTYSIDGTTYQASATFTGVAAGTYSVTAKNAAGCISTATSVTINAAPAAPTAPVATLVQPTCSVATGSITVTAPTGTGMTYSINGSTYQASATFTGVAAGTYSVTAKNAAGCISTATSVTINAAPATPTAPVATLVQPTCAVATGSITVTAPTGTGMTYSINGSTYQASATFTGVAAGTYSVTAKNAAGCISTATSVTINAAPATPTAPVATLVQPTCAVATGSITVTAPTGTGVTYSIDGVNYQASATFTSLAAGMYSVTAKNAAGCISTATLLTINAVPATPTAPVATLVQPTCSVGTGSITITAPTGTGVTYSINGSTYQASATFTGVVAGTYSVTAKNAAGCISTAVSVTINAAPATPAVPTYSFNHLNCAGDTAFITVDPTQGFTYSINGNDYQTSNVFNNVGPGVYVVTVKNPAGCVSSGIPFSITPGSSGPDAPTVNTTQPTCSVATGSITITAPTGTGMTYSIDGINYQASATFTTLAAGTYSVTAKNAAGCVSTATSVTINAAPATPTAPVATLVQPTCSVAKGSITITAPTGTGVTYSVDGVNYQASATFTGVAAGTYSVTAKNAAGCISTATSVTINAAPATPAAPTATTVQPTCSVATGSITVTAPTGTGITYSIDGINYQASATFTGVAAGTYSVTAKNAAGCISTATSVTINAAPATPAAPTATTVQPTCSVATGSITVTAPTGTGMTYSINGTTYQASATFTGVAAGTYSVTAKNAAGCISTATSVMINAAPATPAAPTATTVQPTCSVATGSITITAPTGTGVTYSIDGVNYQASATFTALAAGTYSVTAKNAAGCISTATSVTINAAPATPSAPTVTSVQPTCSVATGSITVTAPTGTGMTYSIDGTTYQASATFTGVAAGTYSVTAKNAAGCVSTATSVTINAAPATPAAPTATTFQPTCSVGTGSITITAPTGTGVTYSINGSTYQASATFTTLAAGTYSVTAKNAAGCISTATSVTINAAPATPATPTVTTVQPTCSVATGSITVTAPTGTGVTYSIDGINYQASATFTALAAGTYSVTAKNAAGCISTATSVTINPVASAPSAPVASAQAVCTRATVAELTATGTNLQWFLSNEATTALASTTALTNGTYYVSQTVNGCVSERTPVAVTLNSAPVINPLTDVQACTSYALPPLTNGAYYSAPGGAGIEIAAGTLITASQRIYVYASNSCGSDQQWFDVIIIPTPVIAPVSNVTACQGYTLPQLSLGNYYTAPNGQGTLLHAGEVITQTSTIYIYATAGNIVQCSAERSFTVTINVTPAAVAEAQTFCGSATVASLVATGENLKWYADATGTEVLASTAALATGTYYVSQTINGCEGERTAVAVTVNVTPAAVAEAQTFCGSATVASLVATGENLKWYADAISAELLSPTTVLATGTYYVSQTINGCEGERTAVSVTINVTPAAVAEAQTFCGSATVASLVATGENLKWYADATGTEVLASTAALATGTYYVSQTINGCEGERTAVSVTVNVTPAAVAEAQTFCGSATIANLVASGENLKWYADATGTEALASTTALATGTYYVSQTINGCEGERTAVEVTVNAVAAPTGEATQVITVDVPADATVEDLVVMGENIQWYASVEDIQAGTPIAQGTELVSGTTYYATQTVNGCQSAYLEVTVEVVLKTDNKDSIKFSYYPNPVKDQLNIISGSSISLVEVYTMHGQKVISQTWNALSGQLNMVQLEEATYIVRVYTGNKTQSFMIAKGH